MSVPQDIQKLIDAANNIDSRYESVQNLRGILERGWTEKQAIEEGIHIPDKYNIYPLSTAQEVFDRASNALRAIEGINTRAIPGLINRRREIEDQIVFQAKMTGNHSLIAARVLPVYTLPQPPIQNGKEDSQLPKLRVISPEVTNTLSFQENTSANNPIPDIENTDTDEPLAVYSALQEALRSFGIEDTENFRTMHLTAKFTMQHVLLLNQLQRAQGDHVSSEMAVSLFGQGKKAQRQFRQVLLDIQVLLGRFDRKVHANQTSGKISYHVGFIQEDETALRDNNTIEKGADASAHDERPENPQSELPKPHSGYTLSSGKGHGVGQRFRLRIGNNSLALSYNEAQLLSYLQANPEQQLTMGDTLRKALNIRAAGGYYEVLHTLSWKLHQLTGYEVIVLKEEQGKKRVQFTGIDPARVVHDTASGWKNNILNTDGDREIRAWNPYIRPRISPDKNGTKKLPK